MISIEVVFSLVHSLTKSEKRYFRMQTAMQKGEKGYMALFEFLEKEIQLDDESYIQLRKLFPGQSIEPARKHLYQVLMKSLRQYESEKDIDTQLTNLLQDSRILFNKGFQKLSFEQLEKAKQLALKHEKILFFLIAAKQELQYLESIQFINIDEYQLLEKQNKVREALEQESRINQHAMLYEILLLRFWKNGIVRDQKDITQLNDLLLEEYQLLNSPGEKTFESQQLHLHFQSIYFQMTGNPEGSLNEFRDLDILFQQHEHLWKDTPIHYFQLLGGILSNLRWMERYDEIDFFFKRLKGISTSVKSFKLMVNYLIFEYQLKELVDQGQYGEAENLFKQHSPLLNKEASQLPFHMQAQIRFTVARMYFGLGDYSTSLKLLNKELNQQASSRDQSSMVNLLLLLNLQVNTLLKNEEYLIYATRSLERKLKNERKLFRVEKLIISIIKKWISNKPFKVYEEELQRLSINPYERQLIKELCVKEWLERLNGKKAS